MTLRLPLCSLLLIAAFPALAQTSPEIPVSLQVPAGHTLKFSARAQGYQIYQCAQDKVDPKLYGWNFTGPQADLFDANGDKVLSHYAGPTWEARDGSKIVGTVKANEKGPDPDAISWLLLEAKAAGPVGTMNNVKYVQRLQTSGGKAPADGCKAETVGALKNVAYKAQYYFYGPAK
jgi:hypothetical protein